MTKSVLYEVHDSVAYLTLYRPEVKNALNETMHKELRESLIAAKEDDEVLVIILQGSKGAFCSGTDFNRFFNEDLSTFDYGAYLQRTYHPLIHLIESIEKPTVAFINGLAAGSGLSFTFACDFRVAERDAKMVLDFLDIGLFPDTGTSYYLPHIVGHAHAMHLALGDPISAEEAHHIHLIQDIGSPDRLIEKLKKVPHYVFSEMKKAMKSSFESSLEDVLYREVTVQRKAGKSDDHWERVTDIYERKNKQ
ncbi:enoyl-CoA hydratase/isomerase family protein [Texcoconibacillus texcoconensis]|uniref:2-(1,2-epoxy-1,2-dihydrophenyl)acetyl-CoA isomerase n=1 Tax=Texcoconibacillus texcoconensis TaxID=1095777 RepID=A0A840QS38_9BACI|nr:enoyl-CoA hydratase/isomerase family protein [Texcoconibacillus texcoconensis]MBB5174133.1 2-(1,2-epoxy-1,2-dihydrophenyl)acetyl-CoA isomerase [Texcoconibacillus texcoconensis]